MDRVWGPEPDQRNEFRIETPRLVLDVPEPADAPTLYALVGGSDRDEVCATLLWEGPDDVTEIEAWIVRCRTATFEPFGLHWVLRDRTGDLTGTAGTAIGAAGTRPRYFRGRADVGYWLGKPYWGRGLMAEAAAALVRFDFEHLDMAKVEADVFTHNTRGIRLVEKLGFRREAHHRRAVLKRGEWIDEYIYGILPGELTTPDST